MRPEAKLAEWVRTQQRRAVRITLLRASTQLRELRVSPTTEPDELASELVAVAGEDLDAVGGTVRYTVRAYGEDASKGPIGRMTFELRDTGEADEDEERAISPTLAGLLSEQMAHNRMLMKTAVGASGDVIGMLRQHLVATMKRVERMEKRHADLFEMIEDLVSQRHLRDLATKSSEASERRKDAVLDKVSLLAPVVVQKIVGVKLSPDQPNATEVTLAAFMESLRGEQLERMKGVLTPEQLAVMFSLYEQAQKTAEHARSNGAKGTNGAAVPGGT